MIARRGDLVSADEPSIHVPVLTGPVLEALAGASPRVDEGAPEELQGWIVDATLGAAGHTRAILDAFPHVRVLGLDRDPEVLDVAREHLSPYGDRVRTVHARFSRLAEIVEQEGVAPVVGVLLDLGASSLQLDSAERGFSFQKDGPLDMRMDSEGERTAAQIINRWDEDDLADLFYHEGGERRSRQIAKAICEARRRVPFQRTLALADLIANTLGSRGNERIHPATRVFQSLRRAVNEEGDELLSALMAAERVLAPGGRLVVISFHSGEDGCVKRHLAKGVRAGLWSDATKKPAQPSRQEVRANPRARSARLRSATRAVAANPVSSTGGEGEA